YSKSKTIRKTKGIEPQVRIADLSIKNRNHIEIKVTTKGFEELILDSSIDGGRTWESFQRKILTNNQKKNLTFEFPKSGSLYKLYRVRGSVEKYPPQKLP
ncbi:MAG: hypothetical protein CMP45_00605, partial [Rickettsiales bacterium]|nr:hypothetical protein [Rickettsiales bacterium]